MCISSLVGVRGACENASPTPIYFIDDIPGISIGKAALISDATGMSLFQKSINNAASQVISDLNHELIGTFKLNEKVKPFSIGNWYLNNYEAHTESGYNFTQICDTCRLASLYISSVEYQTKEDFTGKVIIQIGNEITEYTTESEAKQKAYVTIDKLINSNQFSIKLVEEAGNEFELLTNDSVCVSANMSVELIGNGQIKLNGYWQCDIDRLFCELRTLFSRLVWLASGVNFYDELSMTDRINYYSVYKNEQQATEQKHILMGRYEKEKKTVILKMLPMLKKFDRCCIECSGSGWKWIMP